MDMFGIVVPVGYGVVIVLLHYLAMSSESGELREDIRRLSKQMCRRTPRHDQERT